MGTDLKPAYFYLEPYRDNRMVLVVFDKGARAEHAHWLDKLMRFRGMTPDNADYDLSTYVFEYVADGKPTGRFITVSHEKKVIKDRDGNPMTLYPLVLGVKKEKDAAEFQTIFFSGKRLGPSADTRNETRDQNWHVNICTPMC